MQKGQGQPHCSMRQWSAAKRSRAAWCRLEPGSEGTIPSMRRIEGRCPSRCDVLPFGGPKTGRLRGRTDAAASRAAAKEAARLRSLRGRDMLPCHEGRSPPSPRDRTTGAHTAAAGMKKGAEPEARPHPSRTCTAARAPSGERTTVSDTPASRAAASTGTTVTGPSSAAAVSRGRNPVILTPSDPAVLSHRGRRNGNVYHPNSQKNGTLNVSTTPSLRALSDPPYYWLYSA
jgi:hypothetical protein